MQGTRARPWALIGLAALAALSAAAPARAADDVIVVGPRLHVERDPFLTPAPAAERAAPAPRLAAPAAGASGGVVATLDGALHRKAITAAEHERYLRIYRNSARIRSRLSGRCRTQLANVMIAMQKLATAGKLSASRMPVLFRQLSRNAEFWQRRPRISTGQRVTFPGELVLWQHFAGQGIQFHPLANWGRAAAVAEYCRKLGRKCVATQNSLRLRLDRLVSLASRRAGFTTWEYFFWFEGGRPPWTSGMSQGTAIQALAVGSRVLKAPSPGPSGSGDYPSGGVAPPTRAPAAPKRRYLRVATDALGAFERRAPAGVRVPADGGDHYLLYSFAPRNRVLNGFLQSLIGLYDFAKLTGNRTARHLFRLGNRAASREAPRYDTGKWSRYNNLGEISSGSYHALVTEFLIRLCQRTHSKVYCRLAARFARYMGGLPSENGGGGGGGGTSGPVCGQV
jgi:D-glucuronyl C5-epimerase C-terminus